MIAEDNKHYEEKMRIAPSVDDLIENATAMYHAPLTHENKRFPNGLTFIMVM